MSCRAWLPTGPISSVVTGSGRAARGLCGAGGHRPSAAGRDRRVPRFRDGRAPRRRRIRGRSCRAAAGGPDHSGRWPRWPPSSMRSDPHVLLTYDADGGYGHPDHVAAHQVALAAAAAADGRRRGCLRSSGREPRSPAAFAGYRRADRLSPAGAGRGRVSWPTTLLSWWRFRWPQSPPVALALAAHATQVELLDGGFALSNRIAQPLLDHEYFRLLAGQPPEPAADGAPATDVFTGFGMKAAPGIVDWAAGRAGHPAGAVAVCWSALLSCPVHRAGSVADQRAAGCWRR